MQSKKRRRSYPSFSAKNPKELAEWRIKERRSQKGLAVYAEVSERSVRKVERGGTVSLKVIRAISAARDKRPDELFDIPKETLAKMLPYSPALPPLLGRVLNTAEIKWIREVAQGLEIPESALVHKVAMRIGESKRLNRLLKSEDHKEKVLRKQLVHADPAK